MKFFQKNLETPDCGLTKCPSLPYCIYMNWDWEKLQQKRQRQTGSRNDGPPPPFSDPGKIGEKFKNFKKFPFPAGKVFLGVALLLWAATGIFIVAPDEQGLVLRFGAYDRTVGPGPHYHLPFPIEQVIRPKVTVTQRLEVGYRSMGLDRPVRPVLEEASMLTSDENIVTVQFSVQYRIRDAKEFLFQLELQEETVKNAAEAAMREVIGRSLLDAALTDGKIQIQTETAELLQGILDRYKAGIHIEGVQMQDVYAPAEVMAAFKDVASAREERSTRINEAEGYSNRIIPEARGEAVRITNEAEAYKARAIREATGESARFLTMLAAYDEAREITRQRMYLEAMEEILSSPGLEKIIMSDDVARSILPLLPLTGAGGVAGGNQ